MYRNLKGSADSQFSSMTPAHEKEIVNKSAVTKSEQTKVLLSRLLTFETS